MIVQTTVWFDETALIIWIWTLFFVSLHTERNKYSFNRFSIHSKVHQARNGRPQRKGRGKDLLPTSD